MSIEWLIYLADISNTCSWVVFMSGAALFVGTVAWICETATEAITKVNGTFTLLSIIFSVLLMLSSIFIPSKEAIYLIAGAHMAKQSNIPAKVMMIVNEKLDELVVKDKKDESD